LPRPRSKEALIRQLRDYLHQVCHEVGLSTRIVPHQFRHYAACGIVATPTPLRCCGPASAYLR
jgi:hypothetical protein